MDRQTRTKILGTFQRRLFQAMFLNSLTLFCALFLFSWGIAVLALRVGGIDSPFLFAYGLLFLFAMPLAAYLVAWRRIPGDRKLASILDRENRIGGLLMSSFETEIGDWSGRIDTMELPSVRWTPHRRLSLVTVSLAFAIVSFLFPLEAISSSRSSRLNIDDQVKRLTTQLDVLKEEKLLDVEEVESRKLELDKIEESAEGLGPVKTFDALDHISDRMNQQAAEAVQEAQQANETLARAEALVKQVQEVLGSLDDSTRQSLMDGLAGELEKMLAENPSLSDALKEMLDQKAAEAKNNKMDSRDGDSPEDKADQAKKDDALMEALRKMLQENNMEGLNEEMLASFCEAMKQCQGDCERMCENLMDAGFPIDKELLRKMAQDRNIEREEAQRMLSDLWAECDGCEGELCEGEGGRCKVQVSPRFSQKQDWTTDPNTPPGDTRFEKEPDEEGVEFKARFLPPSDLEAFRNSLKIGVSISSPEFDPNAAPEQGGGAIRSTEGGVGSAHGQTIHPQHRGPVGRYFEK